MIEQSIRELAIGVAPGENRGGLICPFCQGGNSTDKAFSIRVGDDGVILYKCHRASCGAGGHVRAGLAQYSRAAPEVRRPDVPEPRLGLAGVTIRRIYDLYGITAETVEYARIESFSSDSLGERVCIPIEGPRGKDLRGYLRGYEYRELPPYTRRDKSRHYRLSDGLWAGCFSYVSPNRVVIVEDSWSAIKVMQELPGTMGYALMGTHMTPEHVLEVNRLNAETFLCLDRDATEKAIRYRYKYRHLADFKVCPVPKDLKYLNSKEMEEILE